MPARRSLTRAILIGIGCLALVAGCSDDAGRRERQLSDPDPFERWLAAVALAEQHIGPGEEVARTLIAGLDDPWASVRTVSRRELLAAPWLTLGALTKDLLRRQLSPLDDSAQLLRVLLDCEPVGTGGDFVACGAAYRRAEFVRILAHPRVPFPLLLDQLAPCFSHADPNVQLFAAACMQSLDPTGIGLWKRFSQMAGNCEPTTRERLTRCVLALWQGLERSERKAQVELVRARMVAAPSELLPLLSVMTTSADLALRRDALVCLLGAASIAPASASPGVKGADPGAVLLVADLRSSDGPRRARAVLRALRQGALALPAVAELEAAADDPDPAVRMLAHAARMRMRREVEERGAAFRPTRGQLR